jgi:tRNA A37 threonylcarbamoyltransferase TsaD
MQILGISPSAISHSVKIFKEKMVNDKEVKNQFEKVNSQFDGLLPKSISYTFYELPHLANI